MDDLGQLFRLFEIGHMDRRELELLVANLDAEDRRRAVSLSDMGAWATAAAEVGNVDRLLAGSPKPGARGGAVGGRKRTATIDWDSYERSKAYLLKVSREDSARDELQEAARARLRHFEKRDGYLYRTAGKTSLERYCELLERRG